MMKFLRVLPAMLAAVLFASAAYAQNVLPAIQGPNGPVMADPVVNIGYDSNTSLPCVVGKTSTCSLLGSGGGGLVAVTAHTLAPTCPDTTTICGLTSDTHGSTPSLLRDASGNNISFSDTRAVDQTLNSATGNLAYTVNLDGGEASVGFSIAGLTASGATFTVECSNNVGAATPAWSGCNAISGTTQASTVSADGAYVVEVGGRTSVRLRVSTTGTGTITISSTASTAPRLLPWNQPVAGTTGGATSFGLQSAATTNSTNVKPAAGILYGMNLLNTTTTIYYLRMYDLAAAPTCSSATGFARTWPIPPASASGLSGGIAVHLPAMGVSFTNGIGFCLTAGPTSTDNTAAATGIYANLDYK